MLQGDGGSDALKAPALIVGIAFLIVTVLYVAKRCGPNLFGQETIPRNYLRGSNDPSEITSDGEKPRMWDIWIVSGCSLYSQQGSRLERQGWAEFLPLSADKVSDADTDVSSPQAKTGNPVRSTSSTQIQISIIVLMPALPRLTSSPSASSPNPASHNNYDLPREYTLGTSYIPYTSDD